MTQFIRKLFFPEKRGLVIGGSGALGTSIVSRFKKGWEMTSVDFLVNREAKFNIQLEPDHDVQKQAEIVEKSLSGKFDFIVSTAGAWSQGDISDKNIFSQLEMNLRANMYPSLIAGHLATKFLTETGIIVLTGSLLAFKENTPSMLAYGVSKNLVHSLALTLSTRKDLISENTVICILPDILNTEVNRKAMPGADFSKWTSPDKIAEVLFLWNKGVNTPKNGSFVGFKGEKELTQEYL